MVGHLKFGLVLLGGYFIFHDTLNPLQMVGIFTTLSGESCVWGHAVIYLAHWLQNHNKQTKRATLTPPEVLQY